MKVIFVVNSLKDIKKKITLFAGFDNSVYYVVNSKFEDILKTYGIQPNAIYTKNLSNIIHLLLKENNQIEDTIIYYSSLDIDANYLADFILKIGNGQKVVYAMPQYNLAERGFNSIYNKYVKSVFKLKDSFASPKLQFLPAQFVEELLQSHIANRIFEVQEGKYIAVYTEDKEINNSLKVKTGFNKNYLIPIIIALTITAFLLIYLALFKPRFIFIFLFVALYVIDIIVTCIYSFKTRFDQRFLK